MANGVLPALVGAAEERELLLKKRINFAERQPFVGWVSYGHHYERDVGKGWLFLTPGGGRAARRLLCAVFLGLHACTCGCGRVRARSARAPPRARRPPPHHATPTPASTLHSPAESSVLVHWLLRYPHSLHWTEPTRAITENWLNLKCYRCCADFAGNLNKISGKWLLFQMEWSLTRFTRNEIKYFQIVSFTYRRGI